MSNFLGVLRWRAKVVQQQYILKTNMNPIPFLFLCLITGQTTVRAVLPQDPVHCGGGGCTLSNAYAAWGSDRTECRAAEVTYPRTEQELVSAVSRAARLGLKVKAASGFVHSIPRTMCPGGDGSGVVISTRDYKAVEVDSVEMTATAESGAGLRVLIDKAHEAGLSLAAAPYWEGLSVGGMIGSGAHGSSWWGRGGSVHDHVVGLSLVVPAPASEGYAKVVWLDDSPSSQHLFDAAKLSLGLLGVISKVKFSLEKAFKRSITYNFTDEAGIEESFAEHGKRNEFGDITWYPSTRTAVYRYDKRVPLTTPGHGSFDFVGFQPNPILISQTIRASEKALEETQNSQGKCPLAATTIFAKRLIANGLKNNDLIFTGYPVIGHQSRMQTSGSCLYSHRLDAACAWDPRFNGLSFYETTAVFPRAGLTTFLRDVMELRRVRPLAFCGADMYNGFLLRFVRASRAYLGQSEDSVAVDFNYYRASEGLTPRLDQDVWEEVEQMGFIKHKAKPHWAKNRDVAFLGVADKLPRFGRFLEARRELDPLGLFSSEWSDKLGFGENVPSSGLSDGCALEGQCICSEDRHCSPQNGYFCKQGLVFKEARVCRHVTSS